MNLLFAAIAYYLERFWCSLTRWFRPSPPTAPNYRSIYTSPQQTNQVECFGECDEGSYIRIYKPGTPFYGDNGKPKAVIYLHGFDLGAYEIYEAHLQHLVRQGYYVFYPNYQPAFCSFPNSPLKTVEELTEEILGSGLIAPQAQWMQSALKSTRSAYEQVGFNADAGIDTYLFGHSLGGLMALSWAYYAKEDGLPENMQPLQVVVADPVHSTGFPVPGPLGRFVDRFTDAIDILETGVALTMPVAILHGDEDLIVPKEQWQKPFSAIASPHKKMYLSFTDQRGCPTLYANHEQAATNTSFVDTFLALSVLDGVGTVNVLNWQYIWYGLDRVIRFGDRADELTFDLGTWSDGYPVHPIETYLS